MVLTNTDVKQRGTSKELIVLVHAWTSSSAKLEDVRQAVEETLPDADLIIPDYPAGVFSRADPLQITAELIRTIEAATQKRSQDGRAYERLILVGHSLGALLLRKAYVWSSGENQDELGPLRTAPKTWPDLVDRIVLMAGTNRGWQIEERPNHMPRWRWLAFRSAAKLHRWFRLTGLINSARRGAPFIVNLRIQWINLIRKGHRIPPTIQLLGKVDDIVRQEDNVDVQSGADFVYKDVPGTGHANVIEFSGHTGHARKEIFVQCLRADATSLQSDYIPPFVPDKLVQRVVFVMHGIRDYGHWTADVAKHAETLGSQTGRRVKTITSSYGYFPMLGFLLQPERQDNVRWFMDQFTEALARYPKARISFIGHSNGTYLLASALERYKACFFDRAVFAGSVVPRRFSWDAMLRSGRINAIQNYVATRDSVVAIFPAVFELFPKSDLGSAGHNGFTDTEGQRFAVRYIDGGHSAALVGENLEALARFALGDNNAVPTARLLKGGQATRIVIYCKLCPLIWALMLTGALAVLLVPVAWFGAALWWWPPVGAGFLYFLLRRI